VTDAEVIEAFQLLARTEGIIPALECAHALAWIVPERAVDAGPDRADEPVGPRRQGRRPDDGDPGRMSTTDSDAPAALIRHPRHPVASSEFRASARGGRKLLVPYITGGLPGWQDAVRPRPWQRGRRRRDRHPVLRPGDGRPVIQQASQAALEAGITPVSVLDGRRTLDVGVPLAVMTYYNLVHHDGHERFAANWPMRGRGAILPDLPLEESGRGARPPTRRRRDGDARRTHRSRRAAAAHRGACRGFVYSVGLLGVTGERAARLHRHRLAAGSRRHRRAGAGRRRRVRRRPGGRGRRVVQVADGVPWGRGVGVLSGEGPFTVFAPTNAAFEALPAEVLEALGADSDALTKVLLYHVVPDVAVTSDLVAPGPVVMADGSSATISAEGDGLKIDDANIVAVDIMASNGVIHVIDAVIVPEDLVLDLGPAEEQTIGDIVETAVDNEIFTTLVAAIEAADLVEALQGDGPFTVFAPTDEAFAALPEGLIDALLLPENLEVLQQILLYHVIIGAAVTSDMVAPGEVEMGDESLATITVDGDQVFIDDARVVAVDVPASNGVIHVIDAVLVPAGLDVAALLG
jgi:transforming growth factor-beta-induced protein